MEQTPEQTGNELIAQLRGQLSQHEDAGMAIAVYKTANWIISQLEEVKNSALLLAEQDMQANGQESLKTAAGSAGWTENKARVLNEPAWREAMLRDENLLQLQRTYDMTAAALEQAQEPYTELPPPRFFIR